MNKRFPSLTLTTGIVSGEISSFQLSFTSHSQVKRNLLEQRAINRNFRPSRILFRTLASVDKCPRSRTFGSA